MLFDAAARIALFPLLLVQALRVRRRAEQLPEAQGPRAGVCGNGSPLNLVMIGDSSAAGVGAHHQDQALIGQTLKYLGETHQVTWRLSAQTGATTKSTLIRLMDVAPIKADFVIIVLGVNDVTRLVTPNRWVKQQLFLIRKVRQLYRPKHIYLTPLPPFDAFTLLPNPLKWTLARHAKALSAARSRRFDVEADVTLLPDFDVAPQLGLLARDGFHPSEKMYTLWGKEMASRIVSDWPVVS